MIMPLPCSIMTAAATAAVGQDGSSPFITAVPASTSAGF